MFNISLTDFYLHRYDAEDLSQWYTSLVVSPWARCGTFMIGMILGIAVYNIKKREEKLDLNFVRILNIKIEYLY